MKEMSGKERRMYPRIRVRRAVSIIAAEGLRRGETEDISLEGAFIRCDKPVRPNEKVLLTFEDHSSNTLVLAQVVWTNHEAQASGDRPTGMGVQFLQFFNSKRSTEKEKDFGSRNRKTATP
jgi:hypothetical protein